MSETITKTLPSGSTVTWSGASLTSSLATVNLTGQTVAISATNFHSAANTPSGTYSINYYLTITTAGSGGTSPTIGLKFLWTDAQGAQNVTTTTISQNSVGILQGSVVASSTGSNVVQYQVVDGGTVGTHCTYNITSVLSKIQ
jgi:hypothetical protein